MKTTIQTSHRILRVLLVLLVGDLACVTPSAFGAITVLGVQYQQDDPMTNYQCIWHDSNYPTSCGAVVTGANVHVYFKNTGGGSVTITNVSLGSYLLKSVIKMNTDIDNLSSIYFYWDNPPTDLVYGMGEPVWYKVDPPEVPAGGMAQAVIRLRYVPTNSTVSVGIMSGGNPTVTTNITRSATAPQLASIGYSADLTKVYLHWRKSGGAAPTSVYMDGTNVTSLTTTVGGTNNFGASVINLTSALPFWSYHVYQGVFADGSKATASQRAWTNKFIYATYGKFSNMDEEQWIEEASDHGVNNCQVSCGEVAGYMSTPGGAADALAHGFGYTTEDLVHMSDLVPPDMWFLNDEPDAEEENQAETHCGSGLLIPCGSGHHTGTLVMDMINHGRTLQQTYPNVPTTVNMNGTLKPDNYYAWGQAVDILQVDPYYQARLKDTYWYHNPTWIPLYKKATYVYAVSRAVCAAAEPNPSNVLLYSCEFKADEDHIWPFPTPESKRIEVYYTLAGGAKGMGYWWMNPNYPSKGLDARTPAALALWKEIGILGNEIKTARSLLVKSTPVNLTIKPNNTNIWVRALASGTDALILFVVNDNYYNDAAGCHYTNIANANVTNTLPAWLVDVNKTSAFEISKGGKPVDVAATLNGNQLVLNLGTLVLTKMIVVTTNETLRSTIQSWYDSAVKPGLCDFAPEVCDPPAQCVKNADAEGGFSLQGGGYIANNWIEAEGTYGTNVVGYDETASTNRHGGAHSQRIRVWKSGTGGTSGGCYQQIGATAGSNYTVTVWIKAMDIYSKCYLGVDPTGGTSITSGNVVWSSVHTNTTFAQKTVNVTASGGSGRITIFYKVASTDGNKRNGYFDDCAPVCPTGPVITTQPTAQNLCAGGTATFNVAATGSGTLTYQWKKDGVTLFDDGRIVGAATTLLAVSNVTSGDVAGYSAAVTDSIGSTNSSSAALTLKTATGFTTHPAATNVCPGGTARFTVVAVGDGTITYQWQKDGVNLTNGGHYSGVTTATLTITGADASDVANYRCVATAGCGSSTSFQGALGLKVATAITQQPASASITAGGTTNFTVAATGDGTLTYQWQTNGVNVVNGGHFSGCTTPTITISSASSADAMNYRCVVTGGCGSVTSSSASLTVTINCTTPGLLNPSFELGNISGVATNWTGYQRSPNPTTVWSIQTASPPAGTGLQYQQIANTSSTGGGGVRQDIKNCVIGATYTVSGWFRGNSALYSTCTVKVSPTASTTWSTAVNLTPAATFTGNYWTNFSGTVTATGTNMTLWLDGQTGSTGQNKAECFDGITVTCAP